jgi:hypothetical protein
MKPQSMVDGSDQAAKFVEKTKRKQRGVIDI